MRSENPNTPAPPLIEWTARKIALTVSSDPVPSRISVRPASKLTSPSLASSKKVTFSSSKPDIGPSPWPARFQKLGRYFADHFDKTGRVERLDDKSGRTQSAGTLLLFLVALRRQHQDRSGIVVPIVPQMLDHLISVHDRHIDVGDDDIDILFGED